MSLQPNKHELADLRTNLEQRSGRAIRYSRLATEHDPVTPAAAEPVPREEDD